MNEIKRGKIENAEENPANVKFVIKKIKKFHEFE